MNFNAPSNSAKIQSAIKQSDIILSKIQIIKFICGMVQTQTFSFIALTYRICKYLNQSMKYIDKLTPTTELNSLFKSKWNVIHTLNYIRDFIFELSSRLNKLLPASDEQQRLYRDIRVYLDYKSFDLNKTLNLLHPLMKDTTFLAQDFWTWIQKGMTLAIEQDQSLYSTFSSNLLQNAAYRKSNMSFISFLSDNFSSFQPDQINAASKIEKKLTKKQLIDQKQKRSQDTNSRNPNNNTRRPSNRNPNNNRRPHSPTHWDNNHMIVNSKKITKLLHGSGTYFDFRRSDKCAFYNASGECKKGDNCPRKHECILHPGEDHPLCKCKLAATLPTATT